MLIAAPWHFIWFKELNHSLGIYNRAEPILPLGFLAMIIQGAVMALIYPRFYRGWSHYMECVKFSLLMGVFLFSVSTLANAARIEITPRATWLGGQVVSHLFQFLTCGFALEFVYSRK